MKKDRHLIDSQPGDDVELSLNFLMKMQCHLVEEVRRFLGSFNSENKKLSA